MYEKNVNVAVALITTDHGLMLIDTARPKRCIVNNMTDIAESRILQLQVCVQNRNLEEVNKNKYEIMYDNSIEE